MFVKGVAKPGQFSLRRVKAERGVGLEAGDRDGVSKAEAARRLPLQQGLACPRRHGNIPCVLLHFLGGSSVEEDGGRKIQ